MKDGHFILSSRREDKVHGINTEEWGVVMQNQTFFPVPPGFSVK
jgi:hypothetical protein